jgi:hypothetical protein
VLDMIHHHFGAAWHWMAWSWDAFPILPPDVIQWAVMCALYHTMMEWDGIVLLLLWLLLLIMCRQNNMQSPIRLPTCHAAFN